MIKCTQPLFLKYIQDMGIMSLDVIDSTTERIVGYIKVNPKLYLTRSRKTGERNIYTAKFLDIDIRDTFSIWSYQTEQQIGELELFMYSDFTNWKAK